MDIEWQSQDQDSVWTPVNFMDSVCPFTRINRLESQPSVLMVLGGGAFGRWCRSWGWRLHRWDQCLYKRHLRELSALCHYVRRRGEPHTRTQWGASSLQPRGGSPAEPDQAGTQISGFQPPNPWEIYFLLFVSNAVCSALLQRPRWSGYGIISGQLVPRFGRRIWLFYRCIALRGGFANNR